MRVGDISSRARRIQFSSIVFATRVDIPQRFLFDHFELGCRGAEGSVDIPRMREGGAGAIFFSLWISVEITGPRATRREYSESGVQKILGENTLRVITQPERAVCALRAGKC